MKIDAYPLQWPEGWKRTIVKRRSNFKTSFAKARDGIFHELKLMGVGDWNIIMSSNIPLRRDGIPYANQANPSDAGVAVYFKYKNRDMVFACDTYHDVADNMWAVCKTIEALRGIQRWGASDMMERSFTGFAAIEAPKNSKWWEILGIGQNSSKEEIRQAWIRKAKVCHPDQGGSEQQMTIINRAYDEGMKS